MSQNEPHPKSRSNDASAAELITELTQQTSRLVRDEIRLAQAELMDKGKHALRGAALFGTAAILGLFGFGVLIGTARAALDRVLPHWASSFIVSGALFSAAGAAALAGAREIPQATPLVPQAAAESIARDVDMIKEHGQR